MFSRCVVYIIYRWLCSVVLVLLYLLHLLHFQTETGGSVCAYAYGVSVCVSVRWDRRRQKMFLIERTESTDQSLKG